MSTTCVQIIENSHFKTTSYYSIWGFSASSVEEVNVCFGFFPGPSYRAAPSVVRLQTLGRSQTTRWQDPDSKPDLQFVPSPYFYLFIFGVVDRPCHHPLRVDPGVQQAQADQQDPGHHHGQPDLEALSRPKSNNNICWNHILITKTADVKVKRRKKRNLCRDKKNTYRCSLLTSRTWGTLRARSTRQTNWTSWTSSTSLTRRTLCAMGRETWWVISIIL